MSEIIKEKHIEAIDEGTKIPEWVKDDIDKIILKIIINEEQELTYTQLKNRIYTEWYKTGSCDNIRKKLFSLREKGILDVNPKESKIEVWSKHKKGDKNGTTNESESISRS